MVNQRRLWHLLTIIALIAVSCGPVQTETPAAAVTEAVVVENTPEIIGNPTAAVEDTPTAGIEDAPIVEDTPTVVVEDTPTVVVEDTPVPPTPADDQFAQASADRQNVTVIQNGNSQLLAPAGTARLNVGDGINVDEAGRALVRFSDLLTVEILRNGDLEVREVTINDQSAVVSILQTTGTLINDFDPGAQVDRRFTLETEFATITATGTRFLLVREEGTPLEWIIGLDAEPNDLEVTTNGVTKEVVTNQARWMAPIGEPSPGIDPNVAAVEGWVQAAQNGQMQVEIGEVLWEQANMIVDTAAMPPPQMGQTYDLAEVKATLLPDGSPNFQLQDCNDDGIEDIVVRNGSIEFDFRNVLARVKTVDVTVINLDQPGSGVFTAANPAKDVIERTALQVGPNQGEILRLQSPMQPFHYATLTLQHGCFLGLSLTPPDVDPRAPVQNWSTGAIDPITRPPENTQMQAPELGSGLYNAAIDIDGDPSDWLVLIRETNAPWTAISTVVFNPDDNCSNRYPRATISRAQPDLSGQVLFAYDQTYLYAAFVVEDDGYVGYSGDDTRVFLGDAPQLLLDIDLAGDYNVSSVNGDDLQVDLFPGLAEDSMPRVVLWQLETLDSQTFQDAQVGASPINTGYFLETALPWRTLGLDPQQVETLGLVASISDNDSPDIDAQECMISTAPQRDWQNPLTWGTLILQK